MDGLSLLCNLHADGPLALRRLRAAGIHDLAALERASESTLIECLRSSASHARRFVAEGRQLAARLAESPLEPDTAGAPLPGWAGEAGGFFPRPVPGREAPALTWRAEPRAGEARVSAAGHPLRPGALPGLDERICGRLSAHGVRTLETLHEQASLSLARSLGIPFPLLLDLAAQAGLALSSGRPERSRELLPEPSRRSTSAFVRQGTDDPRRASSASRALAGEPGSPGPFG